MFDKLQVAKSMVIAEFKLAGAAFGLDSDIPPEDALL